MADKPPRPLCVVTGDTHLRHHAWAKHPEVWGDSYLSFQQICDYCLKNHLSLILAGDVFDEPSPDSDTVCLATSCLANLSYANLAVMHIRGQHDNRHGVPWLSLVVGAWHMHRSWRFLPDDADSGRVKFYGLDFCSAATLQHELAEIPADTTILIAHQVWDEFMGPRASPEGSFRDVPHVRMVLTGDYHVHQATRHVGRDGQDLVVLSPGSTCMQSINEDPAKAFYVLYDDLSYKSVPLQTRPFQSWSLLHPSQLSDACHRLSVMEDDRGLPEWIARGIVVINYRDNLPDAETRLRKAAEGRCQLFLRPMSTKVQREEIEDTPEEGPHSFEWHLLQACGDNTKKYAAALQLWRSSDLRTEIEAYVADVVAGSDRGVWAVPGGKEKEA